MKIFKIVLIVLLSVILVFLSYLSYQKPLGSKDIMKAVEYGNFIISVYSTDYGEFIYDEALKVDKSGLLSQYVLNLQSELKKEKVFPMSEIINYADFSDTADYDEIKSLNFIDKDGVPCVTIQMIRDANYVFMYQGSMLVFYEKTLPTYENLIKSVDNKYIFKDAKIVDRTIEVEYISKGTGNLKKVILFYTDKGQIETIREVG